MNLLSQILAANPADDPVIMLREKEEQIKHSQFLNDVAGLCVELESRKEMRWILFAQDPYQFAITFFALLQTQKTIYLPPNSQRGTLREMAVFSEAIICDENLTGFSCACLQIKESEQTAQYQFTDFDIDSLEIGMYTSGTTGKPKLVSKKIRQLEAEVNTLHALWGESVRDTVFFSTVSHQHIYGLLFRLIWPLFSKNTIVAKIYQYPEELLHDVQHYTRAVLITSPVHLDATVQIEEATHIKGCVTAMYSSAGPLAAVTSMAMRTMSGVGVTEVLGSTETGGVAHRTRTTENEAAPWTAMPGVGIKTDAHQVLMVKSPHAGMTGWLSMGDTAALLTNKQFILKKRIDRIVKIGGKRLSLDEMEIRLKDSDLVQDARAMIYEGTRKVLAIVIILSAEGHRLLMETEKYMLVKNLKESLSEHYEVVLLPKKWRFVEKFPRNPQGKMLYNELIGLFTND